MAGGGTIDVDRNELRFVAFFGEEAGQFGGARGLTGTLQTDDQDDGRRFVGKPQTRLMRAEHLRQLVADDLDDLLAGRESGEDFLTHRLHFHVLR